MEKISAIQTRRRTAHFALGQPSDLPGNMLPLEVDIFNKYKQKKEQGTNANATQKDMAKNLAEEVVEFWKNKGNLPTIELYSVQKKIVDIIDRGYKILKIPQERRTKFIEEMENDENSEDQTDAASAVKKGRKKKNMDVLDQLFDICTCKHLTREVCDCPASKKVPEREYDFLMDQRSERKMFISKKDEKVSLAWAKTREKKEKQAKFVEKKEERQKKIVEEFSKSRMEFLSEEVDVDDSEKETDFIPSKGRGTDTEQNRLKIPRFAAQLDNYNISDGAGAALATALFEDIGKVTDDERSLVFDRFKIRRERQRVRSVKKKEKKADL